MSGVAHGNTGVESWDACRHPVTNFAPNKWSVETRQARSEHNHRNSRTNDFAAFYLWRSVDTEVAWRMELSSPAWTDAELDESILKLCDEFPDARMASCSRAVEHCRRSTARGTPLTLLMAMRAALQHEEAGQLPRYARAP